MSLEHPITKLIFDSLVHSPGGFDLDPNKVPLIVSQLTKDPASTGPFHETVGLLEMSNGRPAAAALRKLVLEQPPAPRPSKGWGPR
jgi:hypothetical protein